MGKFMRDGKKLDDLVHREPVSKDEIKEASRAQQKAELEKADLDECMAKINAALTEHNCELVAGPALTPDGRITARCGVQNKKG